MPEPSATASLLTIRPRPAMWRTLLRRVADERSRVFRSEMGLPVDRPIIMTGHQAEFWHPGILAKYLAADAAAAALGAETAWIVVDQDRADRVTVRFPERSADGILRERMIEVDAASPPDDERTVSARLDFVDAGLNRIRHAMAAHADAPDAARRVATALADLMRPLLHRPDPPALFATRLNRSSLFAELVRRMEREPERCIGAYNAAVARHPAARMRPLLADEVQDRYELPLWRLPPREPRRHVYAEDLASAPLDELAPKALLMTALLRLAGCDLFIHGTGGGGADDEGGHEGYDRVMEDWLRDWLGLGPEALAPVTVVTATRLLPFPDGGAPAPESIGRAVWLAHSARHQPYLIRDGYFDDAKRQMVMRLRSAARPERAGIFRRMHALLENYRQTRAEDLEEVRARAEALKTKAANAAIAGTRTWPFPLYPDETLMGLRDEIRAAFSPAGQEPDRLAS